MANSPTSRKEVRVKVFNFYDGHCAYCGCDLDFDNFCIDHIIPLRRGERDPKIIKGPDKIHNYNPSCPQCNHHKSTFSLDQWRLELTKLPDRLDRDSFTYRLARKHGLVKEVMKPVVFFFEKVGG